VESNVLDENQASELVVRIRMGQFESWRAFESCANIQLTGEASRRRGLSGTKKEEGEKLVATLLSLRLLWLESGH